MAELSNEELYKREAQLSKLVVKENRHSSFNGRWYGPLPEPADAGVTCECIGCLTRFWMVD